MTPPGQQAAEAAQERRAPASRESEPPAAATAGGMAHELVTRHDTVCVEKLAAGNMTRGARDPGRAGDERRPEGGADWRGNRRPT